ncbi:hypothetical protein FRX31_027986 [Thalictrum thalictroides]|uniref:Uncharacterized protein n=1 Tax=Thalictrum thalictroides TaxID=46969 RepID=A0A7J6VCR0_THATH|nr:hypothetical protein FRX31_027986 [Thalictrum thalictroides]
MYYVSVSGILQDDECSEQKGINSLIRLIKWENERNEVSSSLQLQFASISVPGMRKMGDLDVAQSLFDKRPVRNEASEEDAVSRFPSMVLGFESLELILQLFLDNIELENLDYELDEKHRTSVLSNNQRVIGDHVTGCVRRCLIMNLDSGDGVPTSSWMVGMACPEADEITSL